MKKILMSFILVLCAILANAQVKVLGKIEPNGPTDIYPTHVDSLGKGGLMAVGSWQERNAIPLARRKAGMLVRVKSVSVDSTYTLNTGLTNTNWTPFATGANINDKEDKSNKATSFAIVDNNMYPTTLAVKTELDTKLTGTAATNLLNPNNSKFPTAQTMVNALAGYEQNTNKTTSLASPSNITYPTTQAVVAELETKAGLSSNNSYSGFNSFYEDVRLGYTKKFNLEGNSTFSLQSTNGDQLVIANDSNDGGGQIVTNINFRISNGLIATTGQFDERLSVRGSIDNDQPSDIARFNRVKAKFVPTDNDDVVRYQDIPKIFTYTTSGDNTTIEFSIPHGLSYTPTMVMVTPNTLDAKGAQEGQSAGSQVPYSFYAYIDGPNIKINYNNNNEQAPPSGINNLKWTILVK